MTKEKTQKPTPLSEILPSFLKECLKNSEQSFGIRLWQNWSLFAIHKVLKNTRPVNYKAGRLVLWVSPSTDLQELGFHTEDLKQKINTHFKKDWVREIHFTLNRDILKLREQTAKLLQEIEA